jgi:Asp-tRNA(Asn)/Glu-tRNA(Gln) amidotransferase A subunit family amidase
VDDDIMMSLYKAVHFFKGHGLSTEKATFTHFNDSLEMISAALFSMQDVPDIVKDTTNPDRKPSLALELLKAAIGQSKYTLAGLYFQFLKDNNGFLSREKSTLYKERAQLLKKDILATLGENGVLFFPTHVHSALKHYDSFFNMYGVLFTGIFNVLGLPSTHVPMGLDRNGLPVGIQVISGPYQDRLCLAMARELENAFGGWRVPT